MHRSDYDFDVISGPSTPPPPLRPSVFQPPAAAPKPPAAPPAPPAGAGAQGGAEAA